jgi:hypothetical protein
MPSHASIPRNVAVKDPLRLARRRLVTPAPPVGVTVTRTRSRRLKPLPATFNGSSDRGVRFARASWRSGSAPGRRFRRS